MSLREKIARALCADAIKPADLPCADCTEDGKYVCGWDDTADAVLAALDGPVVEIPRGMPGVLGPCPVTAGCRFGYYGQCDLQKGGGECPGPGKYRLVKVR